MFSIYFAVKIQKMYKVFSINASHLSSKITETEITGLTVIDLTGDHIRSN